MRTFLFSTLFLVFLQGSSLVAARAPRKRSEMTSSSHAASEPTTCPCTTTVFQGGLTVSGAHSSGSSGLLSGGAKPTSVISGSNHPSGISGSSAHSSGASGARSLSGATARPSSFPISLSGSHGLTSMTGSSHSSMSASPTASVTDGDNEDDCNEEDPPYPHCTRFRHSSASHASSMASHTSSGAMPSASHPPNEKNSTLGAVYFLSNKPQNSIIVLEININGSLSFGKEVPIGPNNTKAGNNSTVPAVSQDSVLRLSHVHSQIRS
jgi:hypothetical protein